MKCKSPVFESLVGGFKFDVQHSVVGGFKVDFLHF